MLACMPNCNANWLCSKIPKVPRHTWESLAARDPTREGGRLNAPARHFSWVRHFSGGRYFWSKEGIANVFSRVTLKLDLGFRFWLRLDLPYVWLGLSRIKRLSRPGWQNVPEFHFSEIFKINSSLMMHCYEILPFWNAWICFNPWLGGRHFSTVGSDVTDERQGCTPPPLAN